MIRSQQRPLGGSPRDDGDVGGGDRALRIARALDTPRRVLCDVDMEAVRETAKHGTPFSRTATPKTTTPGTSTLVAPMRRHASPRAASDAPSTPGAARDS
jgi:hypothetical protein